MGHLQADQPPIELPDLLLDPDRRAVERRHLKVFNPYPYDARFRTCLSDALADHDFEPLRIEQCRLPGESVSAGQRI